MSPSELRPPSLPAVLVVDDDEEMRFIVAGVLNASGYDASTASSVDEAMQLMEVTRPDVILTDALMPGGDGRELCRTVKSDGTHERTKVIIMTSLYRSPRYKYEAYREFKADEYILKPVDFPHLLSVLERLVGRRPECRVA